MQQPIDTEGVVQGYFSPNDTFGVENLISQLSQGVERSARHPGL